MPHYQLPIAYKTSEGIMTQSVDRIVLLLELNQRGHFPIALLGVELGLWQGSYQNQTMLWLRWWDEEGNLLLIGDERAELEKLRGEQQRQRAENAEQAQQAEAQTRRDAIPRLLGMGLSAEQVAELSLSVEEVTENFQE